MRSIRQFLTSADANSLAYLVSRIKPSLAKLTAKHYPTDALSAKQEAKMNWVKCTDMRKQPIFVNIENATTIFWNEAEKVSIVAFASSGGDNIKVLEKPESVIRGQ
jgi:hypothetical protein